MTQEEKAKAYDEAIERMKSWAKGEHPECFSNAQKAMEFIFPELKESEDERIRKALMQNLKERFGTKGNMGEGLDMPDVLAWLEEQGEHANFRNKIQIGDKVTRNKDGVLVNLSQLKRVAKPEQKPADVDYNPFDDFRKSDSEINPSEFDARLNALLKEFESLPKEELVNSLAFYLNVVQNDGTYKSDEKQGAQKPADKVETFKDKLLELFQKFRWKDTLTNGDIIEYVDAHIQELINTIQNPAWSEEDVKAFNRISAILVDASEVKNWWKEYRLIEKDEMIRLTEFLKSLRPQNTWKPSDEQMNAFDAVLVYNPPCSNECRNHLITLYNDLKKLKE